jgi:prepilin peptidase CpaA
VVETANILVHQAVLVCFLGLLGWAAVSDYREFTIPNRVSIGIAGLYPAHVVASLTPIDWLGAILVSVAVFAAGFALFAGKLIGGGDAKLISAVALWAGPDLILGVVLIIALVGAALSIFVLKMQWSARLRGAGGVRIADFKAPVPYGLAIVAGGGLVGVHLLARVAG